MKKKHLNEIQNDISFIYMASRQINCLVKCAIYNADNKYEICTLGDLAMELSEKIKKTSLKIGSYFVK